MVQLLPRVMFDHILMARGFTVIDVDIAARPVTPRLATASTNIWAARIWTTSWTRPNILAAEQGVDPKKIGLWGGSLRRFHHPDGDVHAQPDVFAAGGALAPVSDWAPSTTRLNERSSIRRRPTAESLSQIVALFFATDSRARYSSATAMVDYQRGVRRHVRLVNA